MSMSTPRGISAPHKLHQLCKRCDSIFSGSSVLKVLSQERELYHFHDNFGKLWQSAATGCHFCALVKSSLHLPGDPGDADEDAQGETSPLYLEIAPNISGWPCPFRVGCRYDDDNGWRGFAIREDSSTRLHPSLAQAKTCSPEHADLAQTWIQTCLTRHASTCGHSNDPRFLPTRLIEISGFEEDLRVRLYLTSAADLQHGLQYCTLSHCWGDTGVLCLTTASLQAYQQAIPLATIPATYTDAMQITRSLGLRYLWIDSLCILQDSLDDWAREASAMAMIYENTYCNIAAAAAKNSRDGCYGNRDPFSFGPCRIAKIDEKELYAHPYSYKGTLEELEERSKTGLFSRAWILQELLLSPRVLYFGPEGLYFSCKKLRADESNIDGKNYPFLDPALMPVFKESAASRALRSFQCATQNKIPESKFPHGLHSVWFDIVSRYSELNLSEKGDKLIALSGVAESIIVTRKGEEYLAGLWRSTFLSDLLWFRAGKTRPRPAEFRAPTWSWASVDNHVEAWNWPVLSNAEISFMASLVDVTIITHPEDRHKTGKVYGSRLEMKGRLRKVPSSCGLKTHEMFAHNINYDTEDLRDLMQKRSRAVRGSRDTNKDPKVYYMPIRCIREMDVSHFHLADAMCECGIQGLLVMPVHEGFERVGLFEMSAKKWSFDSKDTAMFDSEIFHYFDDYEEERIIFLDGTCRSPNWGFEGNAMNTSLI